MIETKKLTANGEARLYIVGSKCCSATYANTQLPASGRVNALIEEADMTDCLPAASEGFKMVSLVLQRDISAGEEIFLHYGSTYDLPSVFVDEVGESGSTEAPAAAASTEAGATGASTSDDDMDCSDGEGEAPSKRKRSSKK